MECRPYHPIKLPLRRLQWEQFIHLLGPAHAVIARYDEMLKRVKNGEKVFALLTAREVISSLSAPQSPPLTCTQWLHMRALGQTKKIERVFHYDKALDKAEKYIRTHQISLKLIQKIHLSIKKEGQSTFPIGKFRSFQNWIGPEGGPKEEAYFYPPSVKVLPHALHNLKAYLSYHEYDSLVHLAVFIAQFLIIHPFMDGNGRLARILIPLFLYQEGLTSQPMFYLSHFFRKHRAQYFQRLFDITAEKRWEEWFVFLFKGIIEEGEDLVKRAKHILALYEEFKETSRELGISEKLVDLLFASPVLMRGKLKEYEKDLKKLEKKALIATTHRESVLLVPRLLAISE